MAETWRPVLIADPDPARFEWLKKVLDEEFGVGAEQVETFHELQKRVEESNDFRKQAEKTSPPFKQTRDNDWSLILIGSDLPLTHILRPGLGGVKGYFTTLLSSFNPWGDLILVHVSTQDRQIDWKGMIPPPHFRLSDPPTPDERRGLVNALEGLGGLSQVPSAEFKIIWDKTNRILREQIRALDEGRNLQDGENHMIRLINMCWDCRSVERVEIKSLGQGKSGASVFRICVEDKPAGVTEVKKSEFVLKLCAANAVWKLESEVCGHIQASDGLGHPGYRVHLPVLKPVHRPCGGLERLEQATGQPNNHIVRSGHWYAVHYDFLGGEGFYKDEFIDLETALITPAEVLEKRLAIIGFPVKSAEADTVRAGRAYVLETILQWLCENWYANPKAGYIERKVSQVWDISDAPEQAYIAMPPYRLTGRSKGWVQSFINGLEAEMGERFFKPDWAQLKDKVFRLVSEDPPTIAQLGKLGESLPMVLSHVHGDLNANNIILWLKHKHPFLIDFPCYQQAGHALQDFARLEAEIKFALLDRQKDSPEEDVKAFEHTYSQVPIWQEMEDRLLDRWDQETSEWRSTGYAGNVQLCFELVQLIRRKAREVQQNNQVPGPAAGDFLTEYWPALLYHTVRAISYPSLSVFKRLLAVYSAGSILTRLNCFSV
jgi:hypothetical protein